MRPHVDQAFIGQLFAHPAFQLRLQQANLPQSRKEQPEAVALAEEICGMLSAEYQMRVDEECLSLYRAHSQLTKEVEQLKNALILSSPSKTMGSPSKDTPSILSEVELDEGRKMIEGRGGRGNTSFLSSFLCESEIPDKQQLEERINASIVNLSGDVAKFQSAVEERLRNVENSLNRKMESIYKTLTSVFETINDLQSRLNSRQKKESNGRAPVANGQKQTRREALQKAIDLSDSQTRPARQKQQSQTGQGESGGRRRSFLGFLKY